MKMKHKDKKLYYLKESWLSLNESVINKLINKQTKVFYSRLKIKLTLTVQDFPFGFISFHPNWSP